MDDARLDLLDALERQRALLQRVRDRLADTPRIHPATDTEWAGDARVAYEARVRLVHRVLAGADDALAEAVHGTQRALGTVRGG